MTALPLVFVLPERRGQGTKRASTISSLQGIAPAVLPSDDAMGGRQSWRASGVGPRRVEVEEGDD